ncbi:protein tyrosine/serine phosphatase [Niveomyces insectorum RCEF 264]|uniref:Protein tyrosine/serine phosphatase n=1 Tax=Niveomyces insectorum RCEF 264 TaxID=1081102 RepID=A0A162J9Z9_9HYPO|nr:protein tyrosine/serine phosphatase [Niveomyces insectorum RCEF 264]
MATDEAVEKIRSLGVTHIYDLRSNTEIQKMQVSDSKASVINWPGVERVSSPVFPEESYDPVSLAKRHAEYQDDSPKGMVNAYLTILKTGAPAYRTIMQHILEHPPPQNAFIIHCTAGKDRTGVLGALILSLCGVPDEVVADEYSLTEDGLGAWTEFLVSAILKQGATTEAGARRMVGARRDSMLDTLKMLQSEFGGAAGYFETECGFTKEEIEQIRSHLIVRD